jgi:hypothetical protein
MTALLLLLSCSDYEVAVRETTDVFLQDPPEQVDILLVVDNSASMGPYQEALGQNFAGFIQYFTEADVDYHIAVTSTTLAPGLPVGSWGCTAEDVADIVEDGEIAGPLILAPGTPNAEQKFAELVDVGTCGSGAEMGLHASYVALTQRVLDGTNAGFLREDAALSIIYVSDEEDASPEPVWVYVNELRAIKAMTGRDAVTLSALVALTPSQCPDELAPAVPGTRYVAAAEETAGVVADICTEDFGQIVQDLSLNASRLQDTYWLSEWPEVSSIEVTIGEERIPCGDWTYRVLPDADEVDSPAIVFEREAMPRSLTEIQVYYRYGTGQELDACP